MRAPAMGQVDLQGQVDWRRCLRLGLIGAAVAAVLVVLAIGVSPAPHPGSTDGGYTRLYTPPHSGFDVLLNHADGQAYATLAQDPTLSRPGNFVAGSAGAPTFAGRPLLPAAVWALSIGRPSLLPFAFVVIEAVGGGLLVFGGAAVIHATGRRRVDRLALVALALPGALTGLAWLGPDVLGLGAVLVAMVLWTGTARRPALAAALFVVAGLTRETMLVVPAALLVEGWFRRGWRWADLMLAVPFAAYVGWATVVRARFSVSTGQGLRRNLDLPLVGFVRSIGGWGTVGVIVVVLQFALVGAALVRPVSRRLWWLVLAYGLVMTLTARPVWADWAAGVRVTLPVVVLALLSVRLPDGVRMALGRGRSRAAPAS